VLLGDQPIISPKQLEQIYLYRMGDLIEVQKHGSLHEYLLRLHQNGHQPIAAFWWGQQRVVSICSPDLIKDTIKLTNKPSMPAGSKVQTLCTLSVRLLGHANQI